MSKSTLEQVEEFHWAFGHPISIGVNIGDRALNDFRMKLLTEELLELQAALITQDQKEVLDALLDIQYVLDGAFLAFGFSHVKAQAFTAVHESNMSKLGADGKPIYREDGKVLKGPNYKPVDLEPFLAKLAA